MVISAKKLVFHFLYLVLIACSMLFLPYLSDFRSVSIAGTIISALVLSMNMIYFKKAFSPTNIILMCFILFQFGLPILYAVDSGYQNWYLQQMSSDALVRNAIFSVVCIEVFAYGLIVAPKRETNKKENEGFLSDNNKKTILFFARTLLFITGAVAVPLGIYVSYLGIIHGYNYIKDDSMNIYNGLTRFAQEFFVAAIILCIVFSEEKKSKKIYKFIAIMYSLILLLSGARTVSLAIFLTLLFIKNEEDPKHKVKKTIAILLGIAVIAFAGSAVAEQRYAGKITNESLNKRIESVVEEMGFNFTTINFVESFVPSVKDYQYGKTYMKSVISLVPKTLDPTGTLERMNEAVPENELVEWLSSKYGKLYAFGVGYSVIAEAYYNFGYMGFICVFVQGVIISLLMGRTNNTKFRKYITYIMLFALITYPRRSFLTLLKSMEYYIVFVIAGIYVLSYKNMKTIERGGK